MYQYIQKGVDVFNNSGYDPREILGCTEKEIGILEALHPSRVKIPKSFSEFLSFGGHNLAHLRICTNFYYKGILACTQKIKDTNYKFFSKWRTIQDCFPEDGLVFCYNQEYEFLFVRMTEGDDPPVYHALDGEQHYSVMYKHFSEYFLSLATLYADNRNNLSNKAKAIIDILREMTLDLMTLANQAGGEKGLGYDVYMINELYETLQSSIFANPVDESKGEIASTLESFQIEGHNVEDEGLKQKMLAKVYAMQKFYAANESYIVPQGETRLSYWLKNILK